MPKQNIKAYLRKAYILIASFGIDPIRILRSIYGLFDFYFSDYLKMKDQKNNNKDFIFGFPFPILDEKYAEAGTMSGHYFHQDLLVARKIYKNNPHKHVDIASRIDGFVAHVAIFREIEVFDLRPIKSKVKNVVFKQADLMALKPEMINYCDSISSLHAIEHFGLGRYGDPIDYNGHIKAIENIHKILKDNGKFYFSTPIGPQRIEFNAHRVFNVEYLLDLFKDKFKVESFSYINDNGDLFEDIELDSEKVKNNFGCYFGCGIFELRKI